MWHNSGTNTTIQKLDQCHLSLEEWSRSTWGNFHDKISRCNKLLRRLRGRRDVNGVRRYQEVSNQLMEVLYQKEIYWKQRSKLQEVWLQAGVRNTKYFHHWTNFCRRKNQIVELQNDAGHLVKWDEGLQELITG